jgi:AbrB family looped-hinge helix DNA binding protein
MKDKKMSRTATLSSKFQISIPKAVREERHWEAGQEFVFIPKGKGVLAIPVPELGQLAGIAQGARRKQGAELLACDSHFEGLSDVVLFAKAG